MLRGRPLALAAALALAGPVAAQDAGVPAAPTPAAPPAAAASPAVDVTPAHDPSSCYPSREPGHVACFERPTVYGFLLDVPRDIGGLARDAVRLDNLPWTAGVVGATAGLLFLDQDLSNGAHRLGRWAGISSHGKTAALKYVPVPYPTDVGSGMYYIGDGMVPVMLTVGWLGYGLVTQDTRALATTAHLTEGLVGVAIVAQTIKHVSGRQSPSRSTEDGGRWRPLTNPLTYQKNVPAYDAFPSGHMATAMVTVTVLAEDYPEYRYWVYGIGYTLMGALGFQMMNNDVHWASDYPLAIAIGYGLGKQATSRHREVVDASEASQRKPGTTAELVPFPLEGGGGVALMGTF
jgi:membrane-associated phospholipid phosphatase